jgi:hypothetical protein
MLIPRVFTSDMFFSDRVPTREGGKVKITFSCKPHTGVRRTGGAASLILNFNLKWR